MSTEITIDKFEREGVFVGVVEGASQAPIVLETEGEDTTYDKALERAELAFGSQSRRWCVCRLTPVSGNELLYLDLQRMQK